MLPPPANCDASSDPFQLHYVQGTRRCVARYDTLEAALAGASTQLAKDRHAQLWISDAAKEVLLDGAQIRAQLAPTSARPAGLNARVGPGA